MLYFSILEGKEVGIGTVLGVGELAKKGGIPSNQQLSQALDVGASRISADVLSGPLSQVEKNTKAALSSPTTLQPKQTTPQPEQTTSPIDNNTGGNTESGFLDHPIDYTTNFLDAHSTPIALGTLGALGLAGAGLMLRRRHKSY